ncbi:DUF5385 family protein [Malacoplasma iowae]|uniref:DUF5385 family protein n=1 Tax=Malacoplasma iowae TaxID=2116 RepID=UPI0038733703|nr:DUF5385 family protein [Malacoplasma iowae]
MNNSLFGFLPLLLIGGIVVAFFLYKKKKQKESSSNGPKQRHEGDEVWKAVKDFLRDNEEKGKEIIDTYVAKRLNPDLINRSLPKQEQKKQKEEIKRRKQEKKIENKKLKAEGKKPKIEKERELYVVLFTTRNAKTLKVDKPRAIECEVKYVKINRKENERKIIILGERNYKEEAEWILLIKEAEEAKLKKELERQEKRKQRNIINKLFKNKSSTKKETKKSKDKWEKKEVVQKEKKK